MKTYYSKSPSGILSLPVPEETNYYKPVTNRQILTSIADRAKKADLSVFDSRFRNTPSGLCSGVISFKHRTNTNFGFQVSFINSYDKTSSLKVAAGANVFICSNGMVIGDVTLIHKHAGDVVEEFERIISSAFESQEHILQEANLFHQQALGYRLNKKQTSHILGELFHEHDLLTVTELTAVIAETQESKLFKMSLEKDMHLWNLYNNITEIKKNAHPRLALTTENKLFHYFKGEILGDDSHYDRLIELNYESDDVKNNPEPLIIE